MPWPFTVHAYDHLLLPGWIPAADSPAVFAIVDDDAGVPRSLLVAEAPNGIAVDDDAGVTRQWVRARGNQFQIENDSGTPFPLLVT